MKQLPVRQDDLFMLCNKLAQQGKLFLSILSARRNLPWHSPSWKSIKRCFIIYTVNWFKIKLIIHARPKTIAASHKHLFWAAFLGCCTQRRAEPQSAEPQPQPREGPGRAPPAPRSQQGSSTEGLGAAVTRQEGSGCSPIPLGNKTRPQERGCRAAGVSSSTAGTGTQNGQCFV